MHQNPKLSELFLVHTWMIVEYVKVSLVGKEKGAADYNAVLDEALGETEQV